MKKENELINKISIWYKMRYPDYVIDNIINLYEGKKVEYNSNFSINGKKVKVDEFHDYYNKEIFMNMLSNEDKELLNGPRYKSVYLKSRDKSIFEIYNDASLYVKREGIIYLPYNIHEWSNGLINDNELENIHLIDAYKLFKKRGIKLEKNNDIKNELCRVKKEEIKRNNILNSSFDKISNTGKYGKIRGYLFSKEFNRNILDENNDLYEFIYNYLKNDKLRLYQKLANVLDNEKKLKLVNNCK